MRFEHLIFIKIPKTGGTSIVKALGIKNLHSLDRVINHFRFVSRVSFGHMDYTMLRDGGYVSDGYHARAFKFTFCRNPFSRIVSLYRHIGEGQSFFDFVRSVKEQKPEIGLFNVMGLSPAAPQVRWVEGAHVHFIGRFENLQDDFLNLLHMVGLPDKTLPHLRDGGDYDYRGYYCAESEAIVRDLYREDFDFFQYGDAL